MSSIYEKAILKWGINHQIGVAVEEMAEAIAQITQYMNRSRGTKSEVVHEIADVCIMMEQMRVIFGEELDQAIETKLKKLEAHING
jgi:NTP pyrophosphatase (non-canonical NTP hydrolase)